MSEDPDVIETLRQLVEQIRVGQWTDELGAPLRNTLAYLDAEALLTARGLIRSGTTP